MNAITKEQIQAILGGAVFQDSKMGRKTTVLHVTLPNGFELVESSACVDPDNYSHEIGVEVCMKRIVDRIWQLEGYRLQCQLSEAL